MLRKLCNGVNVILQKYLKSGGRGRRRSLRQLEFSFDACLFVCYLFCSFVICLFVCYLFVRLLFVCSFVILFVRLLFVCSFVICFVRLLFVWFVCYLFGRLLFVWSFVICLVRLLFVLFVFVSPSFVRFLLFHLREQLQYGLSIVLYLLARVCVCLFM